MCLLQDVKRVQIVARHLKAVQSEAYEKGVLCTVNLLVCAVTSIVSFVCYRINMELHRICCTVPTKDNPEVKCAHAPGKVADPT